MNACYLAVRGVVAALTLAELASLAVAQLPAFPGADGAGAHVTGGRGGDVYHVTKVDENYSDSAVGTLRYGLNDANFPPGTPRTIVFDVAGTFWLGRFAEHEQGWDTQDRINIGSNITIAGETAPGPVQIMGGVVKVNGANLIIRNVVVAPGYGMRNIGGDRMPDSYVYDAFDISGQNVMIDHVSTFFATDETISANETADKVTIQYSNISQGQNYPQWDAEGGGYTGHALGSLLQAGSHAAISIHHNLYAHQKGRLPRVGSEEGTGAFNDFRNNVFYNWFGTAGSGASRQFSFNNFVGNFYLAGPGGDDPTGGLASDGASPAVAFKQGGTGVFNGRGSAWTRVYHEGNLKDTNKDGDADDGVPLTNGDFSNSAILPSAFGQVPYFGVTDTAADALERVLNYMGARWWVRDESIDSVDQRIVEEVRIGGGQIIAFADDPTDPNDGDEWLAMRFTTPSTRPADWDSDQDGIPNYWEEKHGLPINSANNNGDFDSDGYTDLEEYLHDIAAWPAPQEICFSGVESDRYAEIDNWDIRWQPSRYDTAIVKSGAAVVDAVGQHAGVLIIAPHEEDVARVDIVDGWLAAQDAVVIGGVPGAAGALNLAGGKLAAAALAKGDSGSFNFTGGVLQAGAVEFDVVNHGGVIAPGADGGKTRVFGDLSIESGEIRLEVEGAAVGQYGRVVVDGTLVAGGMLKLELAQQYAPAVGDALDLLDFAAASGAFRFDLPALDDRLAWRTADLLTTGQVQVVAKGAAADFNNDGAVDGADLLIWQRGVGLSDQTANLNGDANGDGTVGQDDLALWSLQFGGLNADVAHISVPEPPSLATACSVVVYALCRRCPISFGGF